MTDSSLLDLPTCARFGNVSAPLNRKDDLLNPGQILEKISTSSSSGCNDFGLENDSSSHFFIEKLRIAIELRQISKVNAKISTKGIPFGNVYDAVPADANFDTVFPPTKHAEGSKGSEEDVVKPPIASQKREQQLFDAIELQLSLAKKNAMGENAKDGATVDLETLHVSARAPTQPHVLRMCLKNSNWRQDLKEAHVALLRNGQKTVIQPNDADWKQKSQEYWVKEVAHQARKNSIVKAKNYNMKLATLKTLALSCAKIDARKREEVVLKSMDQHKLSIVQQTRNSVERKATQEQEIEHDKAGEPDQLLTTIGLLTPSASSLNAFLLCELQLFVKNVLPEADPNQTLPALNITPVVFEAAKVTSRVVVREHRRALCDFQAETERVRSKSVWEYRGKSLPSPSHVDVQTEKTMNPFCNNSVTDAQSESWSKLVPSRCPDRHTDTEASSDRSIDGQKLHSLCSKGLNCISVAGDGTRASDSKKILEHLLSLREKSYLPFLVISNANDLMSWDSLLQAQAKDICYHSYFGSIENQKLIRKTLTDQYFRANEAKAHFVLTTYDIVLESIDQFHFDRWHVIVMDEAMRLTDDDHFHDKWCELLTLPCRQKILIADEKNAPDVRLMLQFVIPSLFCSREKLMAWNCAAFSRECVTLLVAELKKFTIGEDQLSFHKGVHEKTNLNGEKEAVTHSMLQNEITMKRNTISCEQILAQNIVACHHAPSSSDHKLNPNTINRHDVLPVHRPTITTLGFPATLPAANKGVKKLIGKHSTSGSTRKRISRCGKCAGCLSEDCMRCGHCKDMKKYGGPGLRKQSCKYRKCLNSKGGVAVGDPSANSSEKMGFKCKEEATLDCKDDQGESNDRGREEFLACSSQESDRDSDSMGRIGDSMPSLLNSDLELHDQERLMYSAEFNDDTCSDSYTVGTRMGAGGKMVRTRVMRCGKCIGCRAPDCLKCRHCLDMKKYGGPGLRKQSCKNRKCVAPKIVMLNPVREDEKSDPHLDVFRQDTLMTSHQLGQESAPESSISYGILQDLEDFETRNLTLIQECQVMISSKLTFSCSMCPACFSSEKQVHLHSAFEHQTDDGSLQMSFASRQWMQKACRMFLQPSFQFGLLSASMTSPKLKQEPKAFAKLQGIDSCCYLMQPFAILGRLSTKWQRLYQELGISVLNGLSGGLVSCHMGNHTDIAHGHALISWNPQSRYFVIKSLSPKASIFVNGQPHTFSSSPMRLCSRDSIRIGSSLVYFLLPITSQSKVRASRIPREQMKQYFYGRTRKRRLEEWKEEAISKETEMKTVSKRRDTRGFSL